jgi:hypothetical protein
MSYTTPPASTTKYGSVKIGNGISVTNGIISTSASNFGNYGFVNSSTLQTNPVANAVNIITFDTLGPSNGVSIGGGGNNITVANAGVYTQIFTLITTKTSGGNATLSLWLRKNGINEIGSSQELQLTNVLSIVFVSGNYTLQMNAGDNVQLCWSSPDTTTGFSPLPALVNPVRPTGYAAKVTLTRIG